MQSMKYREKMRIDHILEEFDEPEVLQKYLVGGMCGHDKDGLPIRIEPFGEQMYSLEIPNRTKVFAEFRFTVERELLVEKKRCFAFSVG